MSPESQSPWAAYSPVEAACYLFAAHPHLCATLRGFRIPQAEWGSGWVAGMNTGGRKPPPGKLLIVFGGEHSRFEKHCAVKGSLEFLF